MITGLPIVRCVVITCELCGMRAHGPDDCLTRAEGVPWYPDCCGGTTGHVIGCPVASGECIRCRYSMSVEEIRSGAVVHAHRATARTDRVGRSAARDRRVSGGRRAGAIMGTMVDTREVEALAAGVRAAAPCDRKIARLAAELVASELTARRYSHGGRR